MRCIKTSKSIQSHHYTPIRAEGTTFRDASCGTSVCSGVCFHVCMLISCDRPRISRIWIGNLVYRHAMEIDEMVYHDHGISCTCIYQYQFCQSYVHSRNSRLERSCCHWFFLLNVDYWNISRTSKQCRSSLKCGIRPWTHRRSKILNALISPHRRPGSRIPRIWWNDAQ
jgi:hypothetical protein